MPFALHRTGLPSYKLSTTIAKAAAPDDPFERLATRAEREIARAVYDLLSGLPDTAWARELRRRIRAGDWAAVNEQLVSAPYSPERYRALAQAVTTALQQGTELALADLPPMAPDVGTGLGVYLPPAALRGEACPVLYWLSGLTCSDENFMQKAGAQRVAAELRRCVADVRGQVDYSYRRPSRRAGVTPSSSSSTSSPGLLSLLDEALPSKSVAPCTSPSASSVRPSVTGTPASRACASASSQSASAPG